LRALTGGCRNTRGDRRRPADRGDLNRYHAGSSDRDSVLRFSGRRWAPMILSPDDVTTLKAMLRAERAARSAAEAKPRTLLVEKLKLTIKKLRHDNLRSAAHNWISSSRSLPIWSRPRRRPRPRHRWLQPRTLRRPHSSAASRRAGRCRSICRGSALSIRCLRFAHAARNRSVQLVIPWPLGFWQMLLEPCEMVGAMTDGQKSFEARLTACGDSPPRPSCRGLLPAFFGRSADR
jgi:hypothetical protein